MTHSFYKKQLQGFTLFEVLIALAILAIALTALLLSISTSLSKITHLQDKTAAHWIAMNVFNKLRAEIISHQNKEQNISGEEKLLQQNYVWKVHIHMPNKALINLRQIKVQVHKKNSPIILEEINSYLINGKDNDA